MISPQTFRQPRREASCKSRHPVREASCTLHVALAPCPCQAGLMQFEYDQADGEGEGGVSARVPELRRRHPADRVQTVLPVRNHPWPSHCWQPPVAADILSAIRGRSGKSLRILANRSSRHHRAARCGCCRGLPAEPGSAAIGTPGIPIGPWLGRRWPKCHWPTCR